MIRKHIALCNELKAPKSQYNSFGKYHYRNNEDILEAVKPLLQKHKLSLTIMDEIILIGDRYYIKATATLYDTETDSVIINSALAREENDKKGMDASQVTGSTSSYARKYALNGLFLIDDTKDADTDEFKKQQDKPLVQTKQVIIQKAEQTATREEMIKFLTANTTKEAQEKVLKYYTVDEIAELNDEALTQWYAKVKK